MMKRTLLVLVLLGAGAALWWKRDEAGRLAETYLPGLATHASGQGGQTAPRATVAVPVVVARAERRDIPITLDAVGTVQSMASIALKPRIDSQIASVAVKEGARVKEGDLIVKLDDRSLKAQLAQAQAVVEKDRAQIEQSKRDLARAEELLAKRIGTEVGRDTASTTLKMQGAQLAADLANRDNLAALLSYTEIRAPVSGRIGSIALKAGTAVRVQDAQAIATVNQIDPVYVSFAVPQSLFGDLRRALDSGPVGILARVGRDTVPGAVSFVENTVDLATGTVLAKAEMQNSGEKLWPGAFVGVQATLGQEPNAVSVPSAAVQIGQQGAYVFVVKDGRRAALTPVTVSRTTAGDTVISTGLAGGEEVVVDGQLRLVDGATVAVQANRRDGVATGSDVRPDGSRRS